MVVTFVLQRNMQTIIIILFLSRKIIFRVFLIGSERSKDNFLVGSGPVAQIWLNMCCHFSNFFVDYSVEAKQRQIKLDVHKVEYCPYMLIALLMRYNV
jgi:hypothetical protein